MKPDKDKPDKVPEIVHLAEVVVEDKVKKHNGDKPLTLTKAELVERRKMKRGEVKFYPGELRPDFKKSTHRKRECPICGFTRNKLMAVCPRCNNCMACGSFTGENSDRICISCGNYDSGKRENVPTIVVN